MTRRQTAAAAAAVLVLLLTAVLWWLAPHVESMPDASIAPGTPYAG